jgi:hypothetical protein
MSENGKEVGKKTIARQLYSILIGWKRYLFNEKEDISKVRLLVCKWCDSNKNGVCSECGCVLKAKTRLEDENCPLGKW